MAQVLLLLPRAVLQVVAREAVVARPLIPLLREAVAARPLEQVTLLSARKTVREYNRVTLFSFKTLTLFYITVVAMISSLCLAAVFTLA